jgi:serine protease Do
MKKKVLFFSLTLIIGLVLGLTLAIKFDIFSSAQSQNPTSSLSVPAAAGPTLEGLRMEDAVINVANIVGESVVSIGIEHTTKISGAKRFYFNQPFNGQSPFGGDKNFRRFFDDFFGEMPEREYKQMGLGSGVIIDPTGYILTNEHVVDGADKITVTLSDGREFKGEIKGQDERSDLAVIKINAQNLPAAILGNSDNLKIGQWVVAIGNPFGFVMQNPEPTVTVGVISAMHRSLGRTLSRERNYNDLIQTDAAINPGNSGGPLVNLKGEVVGINVAIFSTTGGYQGIGFAIPSNSAKRIVDRLIAGKEILYGWLGVTVQDLTDDLAKYFGLADKNGVLVAKVLENSPAEKAGLKDSDVIKRFDNKTINNVRELLNIVSETEVGRKVKVALIREKKELILEVQVGARPEEVTETAAATSSAEVKNWRGLKVEDLSAENISRFEIEEKKGVVVTDVDPSSPADAAGIVVGDVILEINKQAVKNISDYEKIAKLIRGSVLVKTARGYFLLKESEK